MTANHQPSGSSDLSTFVMGFTRLYDSQHKLENMPSSPGACCGMEGVASGWQPLSSPGAAFPQALSACCHRRGDRYTVPKVSPSAQTD